VRPPWHCCHSKEMLDRIVTMDESTASFHMPHTKQQSKQWFEKGQPGPVKAKVHASRMKQMVLAFFDAKGLIYPNYMPRGTTVNAKYIMDARAKFLKVFKQKRPKMAAGDWWFHWDTVPIYTAAMVTGWMAARQFQVIENPPYSPDLTPADFFLFPKVMRELAGLTLTKKTFKKEWEGTARTLKAADFATAFRR
jgi:histone-lysine N-methyltransferase SETMAR